MSVYVAHLTGTNLVKIGFTKGDPAKRVKDWSTGSPAEVKILRVLPGGRSLEKALHNQFADCRIRVGGGHEWFEASAQMCEQFAIYVDGAA
jgi:hypothetical protein